MLMHLRSLSALIIIIIIIVIQQRRARRRHAAAQPTQHAVQRSIPTLLCLPHADSTTSSQKTPVASASSAAERSRSNAAEEAESVAA